MDESDSGERQHRLGAFLRGVTLAETGQDRFDVAAPEGGQRVFGGMMLAPAVRAAFATTPLPALHSVHAHFLRPAEPGATTSFAVARLRDSRSFSTRRVSATQGANLIFEATLDFFQGGDGLSHDFLQMPEAPGPEALPEDWERDGLPRRTDWYPGNANEVRSVWGWPTPDMPGRVARLHWTRPIATLPEDPAIHAAAVAAASDYSLGLSAVHFHGRTPGTQASMSHALFFHEAPIYDDWHLYEVDCPVAQRGLGVVHGRLWSRRGTLVATAIQEVFYR